MDFLDLFPLSSISFEMAVTTDQLSTARFLMKLTRGTALFLNGYIIGVIGAVITLMAREYRGNEFETQYFNELLASAALAGTVSGMLLCGWIFNGIQSGITLSPFPVILICLVYCIWASHESPRLSVNELVCALFFARFALGICVGAGHSCGAAFPFDRWVKQDVIVESTQHRWFVLGTKTMIDAGFVVATSVPLALCWIYGERHNFTICNVSLGLSAVPAFVLLWELVMLPCALQGQSIPAPEPLSSLYIPYQFTLRRYWKSVLGMSLTWYPFGIYSSMIINNITGGSSSLPIVLGWSVVIISFYIPGTLLGTFLIDYLGLKTAMFCQIVGLLLQAAVGFTMGIMYIPLADNIAAFAVGYGIFLCLGEVSCGSCLRLLAAKTAPVAIDEQIYVIAATVGKVGAFVGTWVFPQVINIFGGSKTAKGNASPFWIGGGLAILSVVLTFFLVKPLTHDALKAEDKAVNIPRIPSLCLHMEENGMNVIRMGIRKLPEKDEV
ncbi:metabolite transporter [Pisolithus sp. B1]|nr:metabolite transporter [Pisolithus sp. B1]